MERSATAISERFKLRASSLPPAALSTTRSKEASMLIRVGKSMLPPKVEFVEFESCGGRPPKIEVDIPRKMGIIMIRTKVTNGFLSDRAKVSSWLENSL